jgi:hypothetical protein
LEQISNLTVKDFFTQEKNFKTIQSLNEMVGGLLDPNRYNVIKNIFTGSLSIVNREKSATGTGTGATGTLDSECVGEFLKKFKKGSKPFRKILVKTRCAKLKNSTSNKVKNFF